VLVEVRPHVLGRVVAGEGLPEEPTAQLGQHRGIGRLSGPDVQRLPPQLDARGDQPDLALRPGGHRPALGAQMLGLRRGELRNLQRSLHPRLGPGRVGGDEEAVVLEGDAQAGTTLGGSQLHPAPHLAARPANHALHQHLAPILRLAHGGRGVTSAAAQKTAEISLPVAITVFPDEVYRTPETWARRAYRNLIYFHEVDKGGHFAAWEQPELFAAELRAAFRSLRKAH
jgi:pimeloyl-ACP methyl ester carboxylesterase